jgi:hypothetical protein
MVRQILCSVWLALITTGCASTPREPSPEECARRQAALTPPNVSAGFEFQVERPATFVGPTDTRPRPASPQPPANEPLGDRAVVQFVVDTSGVVVESSVKVVRADSDSTAAVDAVRAASRHWRYSPARVQGCPVRQLVQTTVEL